MMVCLDTTFIIDILRNNREAVLKKENLENSSESITIASPTIIELISGLASVNVKLNEREKIKDFIDSVITLPLDKQSAIESGNIELSLIKNGEKIELEDIMIGAIAIVNNEILLTRNKKHFDKIKGLKIESY